MYERSKYIGFSEITCLTILSMFLLQCEQIETVLFSPITASVDEDNTGAVISVDVPCTPSDDLMTYPSFNTSGATSLFTFDNQTVGAAAGNCRRFYPDTVQAAEQGQTIDMDHNQCDNYVSYDCWTDVDCSDTSSMSGLNKPCEWTATIHPHECSGTQVVFSNTPPYLFTLVNFAHYSYDEAENEAITTSEELVPFKWSAVFLDEEMGLGKVWPENGQDELYPDLTAAWLTGATQPNPTDTVVVGGAAMGALTDEREILDSLASADTLTGAMLVLRRTKVPATQTAPEKLRFQITPLEYAPDVPLVDVWARSVADFWVVGNDLQRTCPRVTGKVFHCNDEACEEEIVVPGVFLKSIFALSESDIYVVGGNDEENQGGVLLRRIDGTWSRVELPTDVPLNKIWGTASNNMYAVGGAPGLVPSSVALRLNDDGWQLIDIPTELPLYDVLQTEDGVVHFAGEEGFFAGKESFYAGKEGFCTL